MKTPKIPQENIPLYFEGALTFLKINCPTNRALENLDTLQLTSDQPWNPNDLEIPQHMVWLLQGQTKEDKKELAKRLAPWLGTTNIESVECTLEVTTWMEGLDPQVPIHWHLKARVPQVGIPRIQEDVTMDTIFPQEIGEIKDFLGHKCAQVFVGIKSKHIFIILLHKEAEGPWALQDFFQYIRALTRCHYD